MTHPRWNGNEVANYDRLVKTCKSPEGEGLAYTAVMEMYHARLELERHEGEKRRIRDAIDMIAEGICTLECILGIDIHKMSERNFQKRMDAARARDKKNDTGTV